jgi:hypothetical protein
MATFTSSNKILLFEEQVMYIQYGFLYLKLSMPKLTVWDER